MSIQNKDGNASNDVPRKRSVWLLAYSLQYAVLICLQLLTAKDMGDVAAVIKLHDDTQYFFVATIAAGFVMLLAAFIFLLLLTAFLVGFMTTSVALHDEISKLAKSRANNFAIAFLALCLLWLIVKPSLIGKYEVTLKATENASVVNHVGEDAHSFLFIRLANGRVLSGKEAVQFTRGDASLDAKSGLTSLAPTHVQHGSEAKVGNNSSLVLLPCPEGGLQYLALLRIQANADYSAWSKPRVLVDGYTWRVKLVASNSAAYADQFIARAGCFYRPNEGQISPKGVSDGQSKNAFYQ